MHKYPRRSEISSAKASYQGIFMAYRSTRHSRVYDPQSRKVEWLNTVNFLEHIPGRRLLRKDRETKIARVIASIEYDGNNDHYCEATGQMRVPVDVQRLVK